MWFNFYSSWRLRFKNEEIGSSVLSRAMYPLFFVLFFCVFFALYQTIKSSLKPLPEISLKPHASSSPSSVGGGKHPELHHILQRNIFNVDGVSPESEYGDNALFCKKDVPQSHLPIVVSGIIFGGSSSASLALVSADGKAPASLMKAGDKISGEIEIKGILKDRIYVSTSVCPEYVALDLNLPHPGRSSRAARLASNEVTYQEPGFERTGNNTKVTRQWIDNVLENNLSDVLAQARAVPNIVNGQVRGFVMNQIMPDSVYAKVGIQEGDVISSVNGIGLNDAARAIQTLNSMRVEDKIKLDVVRDGVPVQLNVSVQ